jgi:hypothetical protein
MSLLIWAIVGAIGGFVICAVASRMMQHRIAPAVLVAACAIALGVARWADGQPGQAAVLQAQAFIVGFALFASAVGGLSSRARAGR